MNGSSISITATGTHNGYEETKAEQKGKRNIVFFSQVLIFILKGVKSCFPEV
jgi:hypothetical protein